MSLNKKEIKNLSFEDALGALEEIINDFESGKIDLEQLIEKYELASLLKSHCSQKLDKAKFKIENIIEKKQ